MADAPEASDYGPVPEPVTDGRWHPLRRTIGWVFGTWHRYLCRTCPRWRHRDDD